jgi:hypothetical protein
VARRNTSKLVIVDGSNVAHATEGEKPRLRNIQLMQEKLREDGLEPVVVADAALRHQIDDERQYEQLVDRGVIKQAPAGTDADYFILNFARELDASIVSNYRFKDSLGNFPELKRRLIRFMIVHGEVVLEKRSARRKSSRQ